jgi:iron complex transport system substrate-binding protein
LTTPPRRIVSFLPSATEMACALGLADQLMGITHECDFPPDIKRKPVVVRNALPLETMTQREIDAAVSERMRQGLSLYQVDEAMMHDIAPDLILTQNLCQVCAPSGNEVTQLLQSLPGTPEVLWLTPKTMEQIFANVRELGAATDRLSVAEQLIAASRSRLENISSLTRTLKHTPRVFCIEWLDPVYCCGHWVPEMVRIAGGIDELGRAGSDSVRIPWSDVVQWAPDVLIVTPCGLNLEQTIHAAHCLATYPGWAALPAVQHDRVYAVDANAYFARPGLRVVDGTELLAHLLHPTLFTWNGRADAFKKLDMHSLPNLERQHVR